MSVYNQNFGQGCIALACGSSSAVAAGTGDATAVTGATIDRLSSSVLAYESAKVVYSYKTSLTASQTLSLAVEYQTSADGSSWDTAVPMMASTVLKTGALTASVGQMAWNVDMTGFKRYVRFNFTPDLSHSATDVVVGALTAIVGGSNVQPMSSATATAGSANG